MKVERPVSGTLFPYEGRGTRPPLKSSKELFSKNAIMKEEVKEEEEVPIEPIKNNEDEIRYKKNIENVGKILYQMHESDKNRH